MKSANRRQAKPSNAKQARTSKTKPGVAKKSEAQSFIQKYGMQLIAADRIVSGLQEGLTEFAGPTKVALILVLNKDDEPLILDPNGLLTNHAKALNEAYLRSSKWREIKVPDKNPSGTFSDVKMPIMHNSFDFETAMDLIAISKTVFRQHWFVERHHRLGVELPIAQWVSAAAINMARDLAYEERHNNDGSWAELENYSKTAVLQSLYEWERYFINQELRMAFAPASLDNILNLSKTLEEGEKATGHIAFIHEDEIEAYLVPDTTFAKNNRLPKLSDSKHLRKLLTLTPPTHSLLCDSHNVLGLIPNFVEAPPNAILADFDSGFGVLKVGNAPICAFTDGRVKPYIASIDLSHLSRLLKERKIKPHWRQRLLKIIQEIVASAKNNHHGCTIYLDLKEKPTRLKGEYFETRVEALSQIGLLKNASSIDGALHVDGKGYWHGFACLLDGAAVDTENRARGARYNSCLRFSAKPEEKDSILIVASEDGYLNIIEKGKPYTVVSKLAPPKFDKFKALSEWLKEN